MSFVCNLTHLTHTFLNLTDLKKKQFSLYHWPILNIDNEASRTAAIDNKCFTGQSFTKCRKCLVTLLSNNGEVPVLVWQNITSNCRRVAGTLINLSGQHVCPQEKGRGLASHKTIGRRKCHSYSAIPARALTRTSTMWINTVVSYFLRSIIINSTQLKQYCF